MAGYPESIEVTQSMYINDGECKRGWEVGHTFLEAKPEFCVKRIRDKIQ
jgi:hypothetical protein